MKSKRQTEGYFMSDHRAAPAVEDAVVLAAGLPAGAGRGLFEAPTYTCSHCQVVVIVNPKRNRERAYCRGCDHMICDSCGVARGAGVMPGNPGARAARGDVMAGIPGTRAARGWRRAGLYAGLAGKREGFRGRRWLPRGSFTVRGG